MSRVLRKPQHQTPPGLKTLPAELSIPMAVDAESLRRLGWKSAHLSSNIPDAALAKLMDQLQAEDIGHCWKSFRYENRDTIFQELKAFEAERRPTLILGYFGITLDNEIVLYGAGTIAEKISHSFAHEGFPVIARCYIAPEFRDFRLYAPAVIARARICTDLWNKDLKGIHLGSTNPRVHHAIRSHDFPAPFIYIGNENLCVGGKTKIAQDYLQLSLPFRNRLLNETYALGQNATSVKELMAHLEKLLQNNFKSHDYYYLQRLLVKVQVETQQNPLESAQSLGELMDFFKAVPVISDSIEETEANVIPFIQRRVA